MSNPFNVKYNKNWCTDCNCMHTMIYETDVGKVTLGDRSDTCNILILNGCDKHKTKMRALAKKSFHTVTEKGKRT